MGVAFPAVSSRLASQPQGRVVMGGFPVHRRCSRASALADGHGSAAAFVVVTAARANAADLIVHLDVGARE